MVEYLNQWGGMMLQKKLIKITITDHNRQLAIKHINDLPTGDVYEMSISHKKANRSTEQNSYLWGVIYKAISDLTGYEIDEIHDLMRNMFLRQDKKLLDKEVVSLKSTSNLSSAEFKEYVDLIKAWASQFGIKYEEI